MKTVSGTVVSVKPKTVVVEVLRKFAHPLYRKTATRTTRLQAHTEREVKLGETVTLVPTRPISRHKHYKIT